MIILLSNLVKLCVYNYNFKGNQVINIHDIFKNPQNTLLSFLKKKTKQKKQKQLIFVKDININI